MNERSGWRLRAGSRAWVAGSRGMVGHAVAETLRGRGVEVVDAPRAELDLRDPEAALRFAEEAKPEALVLCAAIVGGIADNMARPAVYARDNLLVHVNAIHAAAATGAKALCVVGSSCMYPRLCRQPMREADLWSGSLEGTNRAYAAAKLAAVETALAYGRQHGLAVSVPVAPNLFGERDRFDRSRGHFLAGMVAAFCDAVDLTRAKVVTLWGTGTVLREALNVGAFAGGVANVLATVPDCGVLNLGTARDRTIGQWATAAARACGYKGSIAWDSTKPDGMPRKFLDSTNAHAMIGWNPADDADARIAEVAAAYRRRRSEGTL